MTHTCNSCGAEFRTLSKKRLHQRDECTEKDIDRDLHAKSPEGIADEVVEEIAICDVCGERHTAGFTDYAVDETPAGLAFTVVFACEHCSAHNENEAILT